MIVFNREFLFVHNPKTAGTSLIDYFRRILREPIITAGVAELGSYHPHLSLSLGYACGVTGNRPTDFRRILAVTRNPYDREVSMYSYYRDQLFRSPSVAQDLNDQAMLEAVRQSAALSFPEYLAWLRETRGTCDVWRSRCYYVREDGSTPENLAIVRMEELDARIGSIMADLTRAGAEGERLPRINTTQHGDFRTYFNAETETIVFESYEWLFDRDFYPRLTVDGSLPVQSRAER